MSSASLRIQPLTSDAWRTNLNRRTNGGDEVPVRKQRRSVMAKPSTTSRARATDAALERRIERLAHRWVKTRQARENANPKRVYYLSMEFLIGRTLNNNMMNLAA